MLNHFHTQINKGNLKKAEGHSGRTVVINLTTIKIRSTFRKKIQKILLVHTSVQLSIISEKRDTNREIYKVIQLLV